MMTRKRRTTNEMGGTHEGRHEWEETRERCGLSVPSCQLECMYVNQLLNISET